MARSGRRSTHLAGLAQFTRIIWHLTALTEVLNELPRTFTNTRSDSGSGLRSLKELEDSDELAASRQGVRADAAASPTTSTAAKDRADSLPVNLPTAARVGTPALAVYPASAVVPVP